jgi:hypothetical protein
MVDLAEHHHVAGVVAVDQVELPQRAGAVERARDDPRGLLGELLVVAGGGECELADVEVEVEVLVVNPVRVVEPERDLDEAPAERRQQRQPLGDQRLDVRAGEGAVRPGRRVEEREAPDVARLPRGLEREELRVETGELPQVDPLRREAYVSAAQLGVLRVSVAIAPVTRKTLPPRGR